MKFYSSGPTSNRSHPRHLYICDTDAFSIKADPIDQPTYRATAEVATFGLFTVAKIDTGASVVTRNPEELQNANKRYSIIIAIDSEIMLSLHRGVCELKAGEFILVDNTLPRTMFIYQRASLLMLTIPEQVLHRHIPHPEVVEARKMATHAVKTPFYQPIVALWETIRKNRLKELSVALSEKLLSAVSDLYSAQYPMWAGPTSGRIAQVKELIETQLKNPELTVEFLANLLGVSSRHLRDLFSRTEKISHYILRRRLEECAKQLANPLHRNTLITTIAFQEGFNNCAHFSRTFRKQYGVSPRAWRNQHM